MVDFQTERAMKIFVSKTENPARKKREQRLHKRSETGKNSNRRKSENDRRLSIREGLLVNISSKNERRVPMDRRNHHQTTSAHGTSNRSEKYRHPSSFCTVI
jgi:hypothetical protein